MSISYAFLRTRLYAILGTSAYNTAANEERNKGAFVMAAESMDISSLLSRSQSLARGTGQGGAK